MKRFLAMTAVLGLMVAPVMAETITVDPANIQLFGNTATLGPVTNNGQTDFRTVATSEMAAGVSRDLSGPGHIFDNYPSVLGGAGTVGFTTYYFVDWTGTGAIWEDYITAVAAPGLSVITHITYAYVGAGATTGGAPVLSTHTVRIWTGLPAPISSVTGTIATGVFTPAFASVVIPSLPGTIGGGFVTVMVGGLNIPVGTAATNLYVGFNDAEGGAADDVFWLTGGIPGIGSTPTPNGELIYHAIAGAYAGLVYNVPGSVAFPPAYYIAAGNIAFALGAAPEPATIGLLSLGGLLVLRRRRA